MTRSGPDAYNHALHTANIWLAAVSDALDTGDRRFAQRALRAWLHTVRDRLPAEAAVKFGAQLPELLRGVYYDGWDMCHVPMKYGVERYVERFAAQAGVPSTQVPALASAITRALAEHMTPEQVSKILGELPADLRATVAGNTEGRPTVEAPESPDRTARIEEQVGNLTAAVRALARGLEDDQRTGAGVDQRQVNRAARLADEILLGATRSG
ncbi:DUF2267 domain-containing protein [Dactylosporangium sp. CA-052675]|uniref:DUF2267 domain-containing protein n=1 Tax=Dactylosporangium sp. CA-052675 TaxID=3239927 RepID=UPI003D8D46EA